jgi:hypothetical protein
MKFVEIENREGNDIRLSYEEYQEFKEAYLDKDVLHISLESLFDTEPWYNSEDSYIGELRKKIIFKFHINDEYFLTKLGSLFSRLKEEMEVFQQNKLEETNKQIEIFEANEKAYINRYMEFKQTMYKFSKRDFVKWKKQYIKENTE